MQEHSLQRLLLIKNKFDAISFYLNERSLRIWCATEVLEHNKLFGTGGNTIVHRATGVSYPTIRSGLHELSSKEKLAKSRIRNQGGGRKKLTEKHPKLLNDLESLVEPLSRGDPESPLRWTCKSVRNLVEELNKKGYSLSFRTVCDLLSELDYSLQSNKKTKEGMSHPDRNKQFEYINKTVKTFQKNTLPAISVDTKKKENIGEYKNSGKEYCPKGTPIKTKTHDFPDKELGKAAPYGIYDLTNNRGWVSVGISHDTAEFAVNTIRSWWHKMGKPLYKKADSLLITADCGGSNSYKGRLWKWELQKLSNELKKAIHVCHFPPGTSKWNKVEHRMFSFITKNWRGRPLATLETVINLIGHTKTKNGLAIQVILDNKKYTKGIKVPDQDFNLINIKRNGFHGEWNYIIAPQIA
jgi:transposase